MKTKIKIKFKSTIGLLLIIIYVVGASSQTRNLTLDDAINAALKNNRDINIANLNVKKADEAVGEAYGYALPSVDLLGNISHFMEKPKIPFPDFSALLGNATYSILFDEGVIPRNEDKFKPVATSLQSFVQTNSYEAKLQVTQTLFNSTVFRGIGASQIYLDLSKEELKRTVSATILNVQKAFYSVLLTRQLFNITKAAYDNAEDNLNNVKALHKQGFVAEFDLLQAEVRVENIRPAVIQMENTYRNSINGLKIVLGINQRDEIDVVGEIAYKNQNQYDEIEAVETALEFNYGIRALDLKKQVDEEYIALYKSEFWPTIYAFGNYTYAGSADKFKFQNYSSSIVGLTFSMNLFSGLQSARRVEQSQINVKQTEQQLLQLIDFISSEVKAKIKEINRVQNIISAQERNVTVAEKAHEIAVVRYKEGTGNQLEVQNADISLKQARTNKLQSVYDLIIAKAELDQMLGRVDTKYMNQFKNEN